MGLLEILTVGFALVFAPRILLAFILFILAFRPPSKGRPPYLLAIPQKQNLTLYIMAGFDAYDELHPYLAP